MNAEICGVYWVRLPLGFSRDIRPCVVIRVDSSNNVTVVRISSAMDLYNPNSHFKIDCTRSEFAATGLQKKSFCDDSQLFKLEASKLGKRMGAMTGELRQEFEKWLGVPLG